MKIFLLIIFFCLLANSASSLAGAVNEIYTSSSQDQENKATSNGSDDPSEPSGDPEPHDPDNTSRNIGNQTLSFPKRDNIEKSSVYSEADDYTESFIDYATDGSVYSKIDNYLSYGKMFKEMFERAYTKDMARFEAFKSKYGQTFVKGVKKPSDDALRTLYNSDPAIKKFSSDVETAVSLSLVAATVVDPTLVPVTAFYFESDMNDKISFSIESTLGVALVEAVDALNGTTLSIMENSTAEAIREIQSIDNTNIGCLFGRC